MAILCEADYRSRIAPDAADYPQGQLLAEAFALAQLVAVKPVIEAGFKGADIKAELTRRRAEAIRVWQQKAVHHERLFHFRLRMIISPPTPYPLTRLSDIPLCAEHP